MLCYLNQILTSFSSCTRILITIVFLGNVKVAALLLDAGSNIHAQDVVMNTSLHYVVSANYGKDIKLQLLNMLLSYGADCLMLGKDDDTAIDAAYANFFTEGIEIMKESLGRLLHVNVALLK